MKRMHWAGLGILVSTFVALMQACGSSPRDDLFASDDVSDAAVFFDGFDPTVGTITVVPQDPIIDVTTGQAMPTQVFMAQAQGVQIYPAWSVDRGEIGSIDPVTGTFTPSGQYGGTATITASYRGNVGTTHVIVHLHVIQNGDPNAGSDAGVGAGGYGGVGGEGPGGVVDQPTIDALQNSPPTANGAWLYPYDQTVWPRGILAPLLQWDAAGKNYDAVYIHIVETNYEYKGFFKKTATPFIHHPVPQAAWQALGVSNGGEPVQVALTFAAGANTFSLSTRTWKMANGTLKGTVYYNSYGTKLAKNYQCTDANCIHVTFGGATLSIRSGQMSPTPIAGAGDHGTNTAYCRVCHSVSADGSTLITEHGNSYPTSSKYALTNSNAENVMNPATGLFLFPALFPDGTFLFSNSSNQDGASSSASALYSVASGAPIAATNLAAGLRAAMPVFSPDGKHIAFNFFGGTGSDQKSLATMDFTAPSTFGSVRTLVTPGANGVGASGNHIYWPSYLPTNTGIVFELETVSNGRSHSGETRSGCDGSGSCSNDGVHAQLWWADVTSGNAHALDNLDGANYLPDGPNTHTGANDQTLNYEPTANPVPSGGYAWIVFTSRRLYGNIASINPYWSDPRYHDISATPTTKKLWVAAIDLNAAPGTDPSHPAFYLPAQELLAGNSRGYWVVDPCKADGSSCETGDECCGGFCRSGAGGALVCGSQVNGCAQEFEKCAVTSDCCGAAQAITCVSGRCAISGPH